MEFRRNNPGAVQFGNFINYYQFNSAQERLKLLPHDVSIWLPSNISRESKSEPYVVLDVGCNSGAFTELLWHHLTNCTNREVHILAVDLDETLIQRAQQQKRHEDNVVGNHTSVEYDCLDIMEKNACFARLWRFLNAHKKLKFDAIVCFSITMWIHLNHHDTGLQLFLRKMVEMSNLFVVEPQPWKCYQTAERRLKKAGEIFPLFAKLQWRTHVEEEVQNYIEKELGRCKIFECSPTVWKRRICFYR